MNLSYLEKVSPEVNSVSEFLSLSHFSATIGAVVTLTNMALASLISPNLFLNYRKGAVLDDPCPTPPPPPPQCHTRCFRKLHRSLDALQFDKGIRWRKKKLGGGGGGGGNPDSWILNFLWVYLMVTFLLYPTQMS